MRRSVPSLCDRLNARFCSPSHGSGYLRKARLHLSQFRLPVPQKRPTPAHGKGYLRRSCQVGVKGRALPHRAVVAGCGCLRPAEGDFLNGRGHVPAPVVWSVDPSGKHLVCGMHTRRAQVCRTQSRSRFELVYGGRSLRECGRRHEGEGTRECFPDSDRSLGQRYRRHRDLRTPGHLFGPPFTCTTGLRKPTQSIHRNLS